MKLKGLNEYDICNYKLPSMFLIFPYCSFKCDHECGQPVCQNSSLAQSSIIEVEPTELIIRYINNPLTHSVVCGGLEPLDSWDELLSFISLFRGFSKDPIIIYTGYYKEEILQQLEMLKFFPNIIVKYGRFIPKSPHIYDTVLGVELASNNQYAEELSYVEVKDEYISTNNGENTNE